MTKPPFHNDIRPKAQSLEGRKRKKERMMERNQE